ncbi:M1 family peptidase [Pedobacter sp. HMF7647]|uniref:M1 family peptidase n=1 Tax=Hufsiella arboris TaxID=2695275 RepID=A0A7K1Y6M9_9SPHI|nr:M1 family metallopeptidase [Hufsiella arboris]MXV50090.1 M1 family peptidase [Hufsiella arboris]
MKVARFLISLALLSFFKNQSQAQFLPGKNVFTHADTLRGRLSPLRACYDVNFYHLDVRFDIDNRYISGSNRIKFTAMRDFSKLQFDLFDTLKISKVIYRDKEVPYTREANAVFIMLPVSIKKGQQDEFTVFYSGYPTVTQRAPRDGGIVFSKDSLGKPFVATACEGTGASIWWPNKDHLSDEPDSMLISISVPKGLQEVSNGRLRLVTDLKDGYTRFDWFVGNPINNYNVAVNIGDFTHINDSYNGVKGKLSLDYWPLKYNEVKAKRIFSRNVKTMLQTYEHWFGPYPFYSDGYKLVETPYPAMEHQSAISYGGFLKGIPPNELKGGNDAEGWDFIIVHESAHEWFGNNITAKDLADAWIHEAFGTYAESLFLETLYGRQAGLQHIYQNRQNIANDAPVVAPYQVNQMGSGDMYAKGAVVLNMIRCIISDDEKWRGILRGLNEKFYHQTVTYENIVSYLTEKSGVDLAPMFSQYLHYKNLPLLEFVNKDGILNCRWISDVRGFTMPVLVRKKGGNYQLIRPSSNFNPVGINGVSKENVELDSLDFYVGVITD